MWVHDWTWVFRLSQPSHWPLFHRSYHWCCLQWMWWIEVYHSIWVVRDLVLATEMWGSTSLCFFPVKKEESSFAPLSFLLNQINEIGYDTGSCYGCPALGEEKNSKVVNPAPCRIELVFLNSFHLFRSPYTWDNEKNVCSKFLDEHLVASSWKACCGGNEPI